MTGKRVTYSDVRSSYTREKQVADWENHLWVYLVLRPLSFRMTPWLVRWGLTANQVSAAGFVILMVGLVAMSITPARLGLIAGSLAVNLWYLCDVLDGNVARFSKTTSRFGEFVDWAIGQVYHIFLPLSVGYAITFGSGVRSSWTTDHRIVFLLLGITDSACASLRSLLTMKARILIPQDSQRRQVATQSPLISTIGHAVLSFRAPLLFLAAVTAFLEHWSVFYALYSVVTLGFVVTSLARRLHRKVGE